MIQLKYIASIAILLCTILSSAQNNKLQISDELRQKLLLTMLTKHPWLQVKTPLFIPLNERV